MTNDKPTNPVSEPEDDECGSCDEGKVYVGPDESPAFGWHPCPDCEDGHTLAHDDADHPADPS